MLFICLPVILTSSLLSVKPMVDGLKAQLRNVKTSSFSDDEPAYDTVASDEDYSSLGDRASIRERTIIEHPAVSVEPQVPQSISSASIRALFYLLVELVEVGLSAKLKFVCGSST